jgi:hypothetical protein
MKKIAKITNVTYVFVAIILLLVSLLPALYMVKVSAQPLTERSMMATSSNASDDMAAPDGSTYSSLPPGDPRNGAKVGHTYTFTVSSSTDVKAITFQYCDSPFGYKDSCTVPDGFSATAWNSSSATVEQDDGTSTTSEAWTAASTTAGFLSISKSDSAIDFEPGDVITVTFTATNDDFFVNPTSDYLNQTNGISSPQKASYFAHIRTHNTATPTTTNDTALTASTIDDGTVASSVANSIGIYTRVQETLNFSVEGYDPAVDPAGPTPQNGAACNPLTRQGIIKMGDTNHALSTQQAYFGKSYFRLSTNSAKGTSVFYTGSTLTAGESHAIEAIGASSRELSTPGEEQFGLAFDLTENATANVGHTGSLIPLTVYDNNANGYAFDASNPTTPKKLAESTGTVACDTGSIQYLANIAPDTPAGIYQTKINYIASPSY